MRKLITTGISALALGTALLAGSGSAQAETAQVAGGGRTTAADTASSAQAEWVYENWYFSQNNCIVAAGELNRSEGVQTKCEEQAEHLWYLYALR